MDCKKFSKAKNTVKINSVKQKNAGITSEGSCLCKPFCLVQSQYAVYIGFYDYGFSGQSGYSDRLFVLKNRFVCFKKNSKKKSN